MKLKSIHIILIAVFCTALLVVTLLALYSEYNRPWKKYQKTSANTKINQLWIKDMGITDRCTTCHQMADKKEFNEAMQPYKSHSGDYLKLHPVEKFGCVICHDGEGEALTVADAHGEGKNRPQLLLRGQYAQSSCSRCHAMDQKLPLSAEMAGASELAQGRRLFLDNGCLGCHKLSGYEKPERVGPAIARIGEKVNREWLIKWLKKPKDYLPETKMPRFRLSDEEIGYVADYLMSDKSVIELTPPSRTIGTPPLKIRGGRGSYDSGEFSSSSLIQDGEKLVNELGCLGCHKINEKGAAFGPDFSGIGNKVNPEWLQSFLKNPKSYDEKTIIPDFKLTEKDIPSITAYLMSLKRESHNSVPAVQNPSGGNIEKGKKLVKDLGCAGCHEIEKRSFQYNAPELDSIGEKRVEELVFSNIKGIQKNLITWLKIKVTEPGKFATDKIITRMPDLDFKKDDAEAMVTFLLSLQKYPVPADYRKDLADSAEAEMRGRSLFEKYNCLGCHKIDKKGGDIGPDLTNEGKRARPEWIFTFLKSPYKIRPLPLFKAGMPDFHLSDNEADTITAYLSFISKEPFPFYDEAKKDVSMEDIADGEKLYNEVFSCIACHTIDGRGGEVGPDHTDLAERFKRRGLEEWLKDPQAVRPEARMPKFKFKDWEFEALTNYLMTLRRYSFLQIKRSE
jgi:mono/diheme cytochrome c family protein